jgi:Fe-S cluster assembly scaffold protein SufB
MVIGTSLHEPPAKARVVVRCRKTRTANARKPADRANASVLGYLEGSTAPVRDKNQLHAAVVELVALDDAQIKYSTAQNWYPGDAEDNDGSTTSLPSGPWPSAGKSKAISAGHGQNT